MRKFIAPLAIVAAVALAITFAHADHHEGKSVKPGDQAPAFSLSDQDGKNVSLADNKGKIVVLEWFNSDCPYVERHHKSKTMTGLADKYKDKDVVWIAINSTSGKTAADNKKIAGEWSIGYSILTDADGAVGKAYGAKKTPHMYIIDKSGTLAYAGGIDNDQEGDKGDARVNYVDKALGELTGGTSVSTPETVAYGCGVKYAK